MTPAPKRRWFSYSLRTLFVVVTVFACWLGYQLNWIRERHALLSRPHAVSYVSGVDGLSPDQVPAPLSLRAFGERGCWLLYLTFVDDERGSNCDSNEPEERSRLLNPNELLEIERARRLFPEASVVAGGVFGTDEVPDVSLELMPPNKLP
jgi:hypothetical protein